MGESYNLDLNESDIIEILLKSMISPKIMYLNSDVQQKMLHCAPNNFGMQTKVRVNESQENISKNRYTRINSRVIRLICFLKVLQCVNTFK